MIEQMARGVGRMMMANLGTEILYTFIIILCSLMIYFGTKELYQISKHKGIKYFRLTFLFFALAYFSRSFIKFILFYFNSTNIMSVSPNLLNPLVGKISLLLFVYFSTMAIFYLLYSIKWKAIENYRKTIYLAHIFAILMSIIIIFTNNGLIYLFFNSLIFILVILAIYTSGKKHKTGIHTIYFLLAFFWILTTIDMLLPNFFQTIQILIYIASCGLFIVMLYRVLKKVGN